MNNSLLSLPVATIFAAGLIRTTQWNRTLGDELYWKQWAALLFAFTAALLLLPPRSTTAALWKPATLLLVQWPRLFPSSRGGVSSNNNNNTLLSLIRHGGPLGTGCGKVCDIFAALVLWCLFRGGPPWMFLAVGPLPSPAVLVAVLALSAAVNGVLWLWSRTLNSRGNHDGINDVVDPTVGRRLSRAERVRLAAMALVNAVCEEVTFRVFWRMEFHLALLQHRQQQQQRQLLPPVGNDLSPPLWQSNLAQAALFGALHYHGIPSGFAGVALTFVYGLIMGFMADRGKGLFLPVLTHTIADYFIFAVLARQEKYSSSSSRRR